MTSNSFVESDLVSIIIPCYNLSGYLEASINSCILQTYNNLEILIINDGSQDETKKIIDFYAQLDKRIVPIHKNNEGVARARKTGIEKASGKYLFFLDGDDYIPINTIEILLKESLSNNAEIVAGNIIEEFQNGFEIIKPVSDESITSKNFIKKMLANKMLSLCGILFDRKLFDEKFEYHLDLKMGEDGVLLIQLVNNAKMIKTINATVYFYRYREGSVTKQQDYKKILDSFYSCFIIEKYVLQFGLNIENDHEIGIPVCNTLNFMVNNRKVNKLDDYLKKLVKEKIKYYLIDSPDFSSFYQKSRYKNYKRLIIYYKFPFLSEKLFQILYKFIEIGLKRKKYETKNLKKTY